MIAVITHCVFCGEPKKKPAARQKGVDAIEYEMDPYCSRTCCEADLGVKDPHSPITSTSGRLGRQGQRRVEPTAETATVSASAESAISAARHSRRRGVL